MAEPMASRPGWKWIVAGIVVLALVLVPAPLLPPHRLAEAVQAAAGLGWSTAYLVAAVGLQIGFYGSLGLLAALALERAASPRSRLLQIALVPLVVVGVGLLIRMAKVGHLPVWVNAAVPIAACLVGVGLGLGLLYRGWKPTFVVAVALLGVASLALRSGASAEVTRDTRAHLRHLVLAGPGLPTGEARFGALLKVAFTPRSADDTQLSAVRHNRAAILALGVALGHVGLASYAGLELEEDLLREVVALRQGTTLVGRTDWPQHYAVSAALAVLENALVSDAGGLMKEQLDALTHGSGFSFGDLAADRAGVRFAGAATRSEQAARALQSRLQGGFVLDDFFPRAADLPENLTLDQFRSTYGGVGSQRYRQMVGEIEARLDRCAGLAQP